MSRPQAKTTWGELAMFGHPKQDVFKNANAWRGGTMHSPDQMSLNDGFAAKYDWGSHNILIGQPYVLGRPTSNTVVADRTTVWTYDNTKSRKPYEEEWTEEWTSETSATIITPNNVTTPIAVNDNVVVHNVASSGLDITISMPQRVPAGESPKKSCTFSHTWRLKADPGEKLSLIRIECTKTETVEYAQDIGLASGSLLGTTGDEYNGFANWGLDLNRLLDNPRQPFNFEGSAKHITCAFVLEREGPNGRCASRLPVDGASDLSAASDLKSDSDVDGRPVPAELLHTWTAMERDVLGDSDAGEVQLMVPGVGAGKRKK